MTQLRLTNPHTEGAIRAGRRTWTPSACGGSIPCSLPGARRRVLHGDRHPLVREPIDFLRQTGSGERNDAEHCGGDDGRDANPAASGVVGTVDLARSQLSRSRRHRRRLATSSRSVAPE
jgi:hypothetical protein